MSDASPIRHRQFANALADYAAAIAMDPMLEAMVRDHRKMMAEIRALEQGERSE